MRKKVLTIFLTLLCLCGFNFNNTVFAEENNNEEPIHNKVITPNEGGNPENNEALGGNGTYTLSLDVKGSSTTIYKKINVVVVMDISGSMKNKVDFYTTRLDKEKELVNKFAKNLLSKNNQNGSPADTVEMALVTFDDKARVDLGPTKDYNTFSNKVNSLRANGGTNWEDGFSKVKRINFNDQDDTYVVFLSDGNPTMYGTSRPYHGNGEEEEDNMEKSYKPAKEAAKDLVDSNYKLYTVGVFGEVTYLKGLTNYAYNDPEAYTSKYFEATDADKLNEALNSIAQEINKGIGNVVINDGTTSYVVKTNAEVSHLLDVNTNSFKYYKDGVEWEDAPAAILNDQGEVVWDLGDKILDNNSVYKVTFEVWPSQETLDLIADLNNGTKNYDSLDQNIKKYLQKNENGKYTLLTNTIANLEYKDTNNSNEIKNVEYNKVDPVPTTSAPVEIKKEWQPQEDSDVPEELNLNINKDENPWCDITIKKNDNWTANKNLAIGIITETDTDYIVKVNGHDYSLVEPPEVSDNWTLQSSIIHPMMINGTVKTLIKQDKKPTEGKYYKIGNNYYIEGTATNGIFKLIAKNIHKQKKIEISGTKTWNDNNNQDGKRPESITINLFANGEKVASKVVTANDNWRWTFSNLDKYKDGAEIVYTITEDSVEHYEATVENYNVTNTHTAEKIEISGLKTWNDNNNQDGKRPESITINLFANGEKVASKVVTANDNWRWTFSDLDKYKNGEEIVYTITEDSVEHYETTVENYNVVNTHIPELVSVTIKKVWNDNNDQDGMRPLELVVTLSNGEVVVLTPGNDWTATVENLPKYKNGNLINYTWEENEIEGYELSDTNIDGYVTTLVNKHTSEVTSITIKKVWDDNNDEDKIRPSQVIISLYANDEKIKTIILNKENNWQTKIDELPVYKEGENITYKVLEDNVESYTVTINNLENSFIVINKHIPVPKENPATADNNYINILTLIIGFIGILIYPVLKKNN